MNYWDYNSNKARRSVHVVVENKDCSEEKKKEKKK